MRKLFTIETSDENEWNEVLKDVRESLNDRHFIGFQISVACKIYHSNAFREWLDVLTTECNDSDFYHCWELDSCVDNFSDLSATKIIIFRKAYKDEEIEAVREQRNGYARKVEELEEALKEYQYGIVPTLKEECKNQEKEITYLHKKIEKLNEANEDLKGKQDFTFDVISSVNKKFNEVDAKLNDISEHLQELDKFRNSIKKEGDNKYD